MLIFLWPYGFKIRSKADARKLLNMREESDFGYAEQEFYWHDDEYDYCIYPKRKTVARRPISCRGNIFNPYLVLKDPVEVIWKNRKYINAQRFCED